MIGPAAALPPLPAPLPFTCTFARAPLLACRLADLLDAPALLRECLAALECMAPGPETFAPLLALAEGRQFHPGLQRLQASMQGRGWDACLLRLWHRQPACIDHQPTTRPLPTSPDRALSPPRSCLIATPWPSTYWRGASRCWPGRCTACGRE